ncbi:MAG: hypothetical protein QF474_11080 [SAR324 cluster bacterium]|nr:hypothetical protein [SAR324 cluster bacterium]
MKIYLQHPTKISTLLHYHEITSEDEFHSTCNSHWFVQFQSVCLHRSIQVTISGKNWRKLRGFDYLAKVFESVQFFEGIEVNPEIRIAA